MGKDEHILKLQEKMREKKIDFFLIPLADYHHSEYVGAYFQTCQFFSQFTGSNATLLVMQKSAGLWTDGRYFIQAEKELEGTGITLFKMGNKGVPTIHEFLSEHCKKGMTLAFDGRTCTMAAIKRLTKNLQLLLKDEENPAKDIWMDRPKMSHEMVKIQDIKYAGISSESKIFALRLKLKEKECRELFLTTLDDIMWLFNIRGNDVPCNPVALSYAYITDKEAFLFLQKEAIDHTICEYAEEHNIILCDYHFVKEFLEKRVYSGKVWIDEEEVSEVFCKIILNHADTLMETNPVAAMKAVKNDTEIKNMRHFFLEDSVAVCRFIYWLKQQKKTTEMDAASYLDHLRYQITGCRGLSFPTISAYESNAAMMHYEADETHNGVIKRAGMLLVDSGGQYDGATTDVTRTIILGQVGETEKKFFTLTAVAMLELLNAKFLYGCCGSNLDILAREPLWKEYTDYKCGTGHGVGCYLNVHEGPQSIRYRKGDIKETVLEEGMTVTDEPGVYLENQFGIRTENVLLVKKELENMDGQFMGFDTLTFVPIDLDGIDTKYMTDRQIKNLNEYHHQVYEKIEPFMEKEEKEWLKNATKSIS